MLDQLIGYQIKSVSNEGIVVEKDGVKHTIVIQTDDGDCCGYSEVTAKLLFKKGSDRNPIITNITSEEDEGGCSVTNKITFFGAYAPIARLDSESGSGSGWGYGATVTLTCEALNIDEIITSY